MKALFFILTFFLTSCFIHSQTVSPFVFGDEYRIIKDMDVYGEKVAVVTTNDVLQIKPLHLSIYENEEWKNIPYKFTKNGIEDSVISNAFPKVCIAPNGDVWVAGKHLYQYKNGEWIVHKIIETDTSITMRDYELIQITNENKLMVLCKVHGTGDIFTIDLDNPDINNRKRKFNNMTVSPNTNYPYRSVFEVDGYTFSQKSRSGSVTNIPPDFVVNTPDDTILSFYLPTPNGETGGRKIMQMFAENKDEIWVVADNSEGRIEANKTYTCCGGVFILRNLKDWEVVSDAESYPVNLKNGLNIAPVGANKIRYVLYEFLLGNNPNIPNNELKNSIYLYNTKERTFTLTNWDIIIKNSIGYRSSNNRPTEYQLAVILENFTKNIANGDYFLKMKMDSKGNRWFMSQSYVIQVPPINHPTSVSENDLNQQFRIVPNPASQTISIKGKTALIKEIEILNLRGEVLLKVESDFNNISIRPFSNGVYFIKKLLRDGRILNSKFIKQ